MQHVHVRSMYQSRCKKAKESRCDSLTILLSFESWSVMGKISKRYVARYVASMHHEWRHCWGCLQRHPITPQGQISVDEQRLARLSRNATRVAAYRNVVCQSSISYKAWLQ
jgi:hypothetical protein